MERLSQLCERARAWASLRADGELSQLEHPAPVAVRPLTGSHRRTFVRTTQFAVAAAFVVAAGFLASASGPDRSSAPTSKPVAMVAGADSPDNLRELRRPGLIGQGRRELPR